MPNNTFTKNKIQTTELFDEYWRFSFNRQEEFYRIASGSEIKEQTNDEIIKTYKFTNCYRSCDRTSQHLIKNIINREDLSPENTFLQIILFKIFNKIETWEYLKKKLGEIYIENFSSIHINNLLEEKLRKGESIYSSAYIMPSGKSAFGETRKHANHLQLISQMIAKNIHQRIWDQKNLEGIYESLIKLPTIGPFLAFQYSIDIAYSDHSPANESQFVVAGPGAIRGIKKCFSDIGKYSYSDIIQHVAENQEHEFDQRGLDFKTLGGRRLQLIDCQNIFCEVDKYLRVKRPELVIQRTKIKHKYQPNPQPIDYTFPRKWAIYEEFKKQISTS